MKKDLLTKILTVTGVVLTSSPYLLMIGTSIFSLVQDRRFRFDYLIPGELFPVILVGGILLVWAAFRAHSRTKNIIWTLGLAIFFIVIGQILAVVSGLASGAEPMGGFWFVIVLSSLIIYALLGLYLCLLGAMLLKDLFRRQASE